MRIKKQLISKLFSLTTNSPDPSTKVGALVINLDTNVIVGLGWNNFPCNRSDAFLWNQNKSWRVVHGEVNALLDAFRNGFPQRALMLCTHLPCNECMKLIIEAGIQIVAFVNWKTNSTCGKHFANYHIEAITLAERYSVDLMKLNTDGTMERANIYPEYQELINGRKE